MQKKGLTLLLLLFCSVQVFSQTLADMNLPKITSPSPDAAALGKYGQIPLDKNSGLPQISIPLYEIKTSRFKLPISLSYHASGIKVDEMSSWVGTGWTLNAGGVITRSIINKADELGFNSNPLKTASEIISNNDIAYLKDAIRTPPAIDTQPDNFFYNFVNQSGAFVFGKDRKPLLTPYKPIAITFANTPYPGTFSVLDESGNIYNFKDTERTVSSISETMSGTSSWYLSEMISADRSDTVKFIYDKTAPSYNQYSYSFTQNYAPPVNASGCGIGSLLWPMTKSVTITSPLTPLYIKSIEFKGGRVDFISKGGRLDGPPRTLDSVIVSGYDYAQKKYNRLKIYKLHTGYWYNYQSPPVGYNNINATSYRLKLDSLSENDLANVTVRSHKFGYNPLLLPPVGFFSQDYWGYYNGKNNNKTLLEAKDRVGETTNGTYYNVYTVGGTEGGDRRPDTSFLKAGMLEKIIYPTKGYTVFNYEPHRYIDYSNTQTHDETAQAAAAGYYDEIHTTYFTSGLADYGGSNMAFVTVLLKHTSDFPGQLPETPYVRIIRVSDNGVVYEKYATVTGDQDFKLGVALQPNTAYKLVALARGGNSSMSASLLPTANIVVKYAVAEAQGPAVAFGGGLRIASIRHYEYNNTLINKETYKYGSDGTGIYMNSSLAFVNWHFRTFEHRWYTFDGAMEFCAVDATVYASSSLYPLSNLSGGPVAYDNVTVYQGDSISNAGMSVYSYQNFPDSILTLPTNYQNGVKPIPVTWKNGQPSYEAHYRNMGNNAYAKVQEKSYQYRNYPKAAGYGLYIGTRYDQLNFSLVDNVQNLNLSVFTFFDYPISSGTRVPVQTVTTNYNPASTAVLQSDTVKYSYSNLNHLYPTRIVSSTSRKDSIVNLISYPEDMVNTGRDATGVYAAMKLKNIDNAQIQFSQQRNNTLLASSITNYIDTLGMFKPKTVELKNGANPSEIRLRYNRYDASGNVLTVSKENAPVISYQWAYGKQYPVAEVKNAAAKDIWYEGFEEGAGNSTPNDAKTGHYSKTTGYSKSLTGLSTGQYTLAYWRQINSRWSLTTIDNISVGTDGTYLISISGSYQVDDIRFHPKNAQMSTYTYEPLVGMTSMTDEKGMTSYYEYDGFQRLINIRDKDRNIVKNWGYQYAGQPGPPANSFSNVPKSGIFIRNNCGTGYTGSSVTYTVPAGTFTAATQSAADQLAQDDVNAKGQNYANLNGTCTLIPVPATVFVTMTNTEGSLGPDNHYYSVYVFKTYSDAAFTVPYNVPSNYAAQYRVTLTTTVNGATTTTSTSIKTATIAAGTNSKSVTIDVNTCGVATPVTLTEQQQTAATTNGLPGDVTCTKAAVELLAPLVE